MIFLTVIGPVISYKMPNLKFLQELAFGSELSTRYNLPNKVYDFITIGMLSNIHSFWNYENGHLLLCLLMLYFRWICSWLTVYSFGELLKFYCILLFKF